MADLPYHLVSLCALAALASYVGLHHLVVSLRRPDLLLHRSFAVLALAVALHIVASIARERLHHLDPYLVTDRMVWAMELASLWSFAAFVARFAGRPSTRLLRLLALACLGLAAFLPWRRGGFAYLDTAGWRHLALPWGEQVTLVDGRLSPGYVVLLLLVAAVFAWASAVAWSAWRRRRERSQLALCAGIVVVLLAVANSAARDVWGIPTVPVIDHSFVLLCLLMSAALADEIARADELRTRALRAERMQAMGRMAGGVAHDFNNMLTSVVGGADLLAMELQDRPALRARAEAIARTGMQAAAVARRLRDFGRVRAAPAGPVEMHEIVGEVVELLRAGLGCQIAVELDLRAVRTQVAADPAILTSLLLNLGLNARDAMPHGGTLRLASANGLPTPAQQPRLLLPLEAADAFCLAVSDTGEGMSAAVRDHLFVPFFSTKGDQGTGLGLVQVAESLREAGGTVLVDSEPGRGSTFRIWLPLAS